MRILITVKTYPVPSARHKEVVCTAGITEKGEWVRIYPIPYRSMDKAERFCKFQWIEVDITRDTKDPRLESHKLIGNIIPLQKMTTVDNWQSRKNMILKHIYTNLTTLINEARDVNIFTSLAIFKPTKIVRFHIEKNISITNFTIHYQKQSILQNICRIISTIALSMKTVNAAAYKFWIGRFTNYAESLSVNMVKRSILYISI